MVLKFLIHSSIDFITRPTLNEPEKTSRGVITDSSVFKMLFHSERTVLKKT